MADVSVTWLGHASFRVDSPEGKRIYVDPWLGNPKCPDSEKEPERIDVIALTHGHGDHVGETVELAKKFEPEVVANVELKGWLGEQGAPVGEVPGSNKGGTVEAAGVKFTLTNAFHSSAADDGTYLGEAAGIVIELENGTKLYFAGDTCVFGDMQLIGRIYSARRRGAADRRALHHGPARGGRRARAARHEALHPLPLRHVPAPDRDARGASAARTRRRGDRAPARGDGDRLRERWFGATGRRVPEIAVEGELDVANALVLDGVSDETALREAHEQGRPVVVRADSAEAVKQALARPEVASVLVPESKRELLELDLTELTYG